MPKPTTHYISYHSQNRLLLLGPESAISPILPDLMPHFRLFWPGNTPLAGVETLHNADNATLTGYLGAFSLDSHPQLDFDLVLDFGPLPAITASIPPFGYYHITDHQALPAVLAELPNMIGHFDKAKYFALDTSRCAHQQNGIIGCYLCIDVCATDAIQSENGKISVNPWLCQGCGDCSNVCPSGAISYQYPDLQTTLLAIKQHLQKQPHTALLFHTDTAPKNLPAPALTFQVEALGVVDLAICLNALALGASQIFILDSEKITPETDRILDEVLAQGNRLLDALGFGQKCIQRGQLDNFEWLGLPPIPAASYHPENDKRRAIFMATDHLRQTAPLTPDYCPLPQPAAFGTLHVNTQTCTLCLACVSTCPAQALQSGQDLPQLKFIEANCLQCSLCEKACPEQAISLEGRYLFDSQAARKPRLLHEEKPFLCINCHKPFASQSMINTIVQKLQHHPMFQGERKQQLLMCEDCKIAAQFNEHIS